MPTTVRLWKEFVHPDGVKGILHLLKLWVLPPSSGLRIALRDAFGKKKNQAPDCPRDQRTDDDAENQMRSGVEPCLPIDRAGGCSAEVRAVFRSAEDIVVFGDDR